MSDRLRGKELKTVDNIDLGGSSQFRYQSQKKNHESRKID